MKALGYLLLCLGFVAGAYATALDVTNVNWKLFLIAAGGAVVGVFLFKQAAKALARSDEVLESNRTELRESIGNIVDDLRDTFIGDAEFSVLVHVMRPDLDFDGPALGSDHGGMQ